MQTRKRGFQVTALLVVVGGLLIAACGSGSIKAPEGAHMLYFHAKW